MYDSIACLLINQGRDADDFLDEAEMIAPWFKTALWYRAVNHRNHGRHAEAIAPLRRLIEIGPDSVDLSVSYNNGMFTDWAWDALVDSLLILDRRHEAAEVLAVASKARPDRLDYRTQALALQASLALDDELDEADAKWGRTAAG